MDPRAPTAYVFDGFRLDLARRRLSDSNGQALPLPARAYDVLAHLVENRARVVSKDEVMRAVWSRVVVEENNLNQAIYNIRKVLGDSRDAPRFIVTVAGRGYQFIADIRPDRGDVGPGATTATEAPAPAEPPMPAPAIAAATALEVTSKPVAAPTPVSEPTPERLSRRWLLAAGGAAALSAGGLAWWRLGAPTANPESTRLVAEARVALRAGTPATDREAIALIERAVTIDPDDAAAWGLLALAHARADQHAAPDAVVSSTAVIDQAAERALALDPANADARAALALAIPYYGDWLAAERRFDAVLADHPEHVIVQDARAFLLGAVGRMRESGLVRVNVAPSAPFDANMQYGLIYGLWFLGRIGEADRVASRAMEMWPGHYGVWFGRLWLLAGTGRYDRALDQIEDAAARPALPPPVIATLRAAITAADTKQPAAVGAAVDQVMAGVARSVAAVVNALMLLNILGAIDRAFDLARAYYLEQGPILAALSWRPGQPVIRDQRRRKTNMLFAPSSAAMRSDPRFMPLVQQMGLTDYWDKRGIRPDFLQ